MEISDIYHWFMGRRVGGNTENKTTSISRQIIFFIQGFNKT